MLANIFGHIGVKSVDGPAKAQDTSAGKIEEFIRKANSFHQRIKFTAEVSEAEITFLNTNLYKGDKPTENFQYTNFYSCRSAGVTKGFIKEEALRLLRTNSSHLTFEENMKNFETRLKNRGYPANVVEKHLSEVKFTDRKASLEKRNKNERKKILPFVT